ncbi:response regulator transcription factor [Siphonobacter aquaeclarae]|uniref:DNA-binding response regulator, NarL/FixJ family, contains REC and HTH domains n=1 Tax=Siphonobacter aquaeclarae TaxID=563176 RepID=A0A1G9YTP9_9BACT|nr:response regulator transcription factor [Siphonobacter aquaeclarae]SDN12307.1 DNA-binding response regulator, NarL/FixJ family, contains REC and HTH domains [Siphonobacter aquaeclarae]
MSKILIVDDYPILTIGLRHLLRQVVNEAECVQVHSFRRASEIMSTDRFDLVVMDLSAPGCGTVKAVERLLLFQPDVRILVFTRLDEYAYALPFLRAGASGFVSKAVSLEELRHAIQTVFVQRRIYLGEGVREKMLNVFVDRYPDGGEEIMQLTEREMEVIQLIWTGKRMAEISGILNLSLSTVFAYRKRILGKMGVCTVSEAILKYEQFVNQNNS